MIGWIKEIWEVNMIVQIMDRQVIRMHVLIINNLFIKMDLVDNKISINYNLLKEDLFLQLKVLIKMGKVRNHSVVLIIIYLNRYYNHNNHFNKWIIDYKIMKHRLII